ncbi:hypothetical protein T4B_509 [Trichinella pseudospiralis]|uniref:Uncharacterized protein n=1 Tax=Trichinella pseudospiralis TaxID=6337 RepID=A0A0V1IZH1_TRIPS|nr:hypothetical protein T4B_509 [Trichinella pseudospiralis]
MAFLFRLASGDCQLFVHKHLFMLIKVDACLNTKLRFRVDRCSGNETTKPAVGGVWLIRMDAYSEKRFSILIGPLATAMNAKVRLAPAVLFACSTCVSLVRRSLPSPTQWDIVDLM